MVPNELKAINELDLSLFFYSSLDFMCIACADGYFKKLNPTFLTESGYSEFELLSRPFISFFHPDDAQKTQDEAKKLSAGMLTVQFQNRFQCKDGSEKLLSWKCTPLGPLFFATGRDISASHQAELALKESESRIRLILANAPIALFTFEKSGLVTFSSGRALEKIGIQPEEIVGKNLFEFHKDRQDIVEIAKKSLKGLTATSTITLNNVILETSYAPIRNEFDEVTKVIGVSVDVTESRNAEVAVQEIKSKLIAQELEKKFRETFENAGVGIAHTTFEGKILLVNQELCDVLGYSETELQGINYFDIISEGDVATSEAIRSQMLSGQINKFVRERTLKRKNGAILCALVTVTAVRESNGVPKYFILAHKDINELKLIENSLRASEENFRILAETIPQIVWTSDASGKISYFNQKWYTYTGMSIEEAQKNSWTTALHRDDVEACFSKWSEAVLHGSNYEDQRRFRDIKTGEFRWHLGRAVPIRDSNNNIVKWFGTCTDIHDQKIAEEEKQSALVGEKLARENSRIKTEFLAMMSHEIRTPLNSVIGMSEILLDSSLDSDQYECAETIRNSGETLLAIISDVLDLSKIEAGHLEIERIDFDLKKIIRELQQESSWAASQKGIEFRVLVSSDVPGIVNGDMTRIRQILSNLVSNAIKFTHEGAVILKVERQSFNHEKSQIKFEVEDTGIGISDESLKNLFQPFSQIDSSTTRKYGGTGLGLSICKRLVELLGGAIGVKSELNRGSAFFFTVSVGNVVKNYGLINREELPELSWIRTPHVLVVEDMPINHKVLTLFLNKLGCTSQVVENGIDAIEVLTRENFDLILMDCQMPGLDGYQTTRAIRSSALMRARSVPIIATTANAISGDRERCLDAGMTDYLSKPMRLADLKKKILTCLDSSFFSKGRYSFCENEIHESSSFTDKDESDVIDWKLLGEIIGEAGSVVDNVTEILNLFKSNLPNKIQSLKLALELKDVRGIIWESHAIKSSSSYVGAKHVSKICDEIKTASSREDFLECQRLNVLLVDQLKRAVHALERRFP